jgi:hypothetical protein
MVKLRLAALLLAMTPGTMAAQTPLPGGPGLTGTIRTPPPVVAPPAGPASPGPPPVTGLPVAPRTIVIPGSPVPGTLYDNGNGTSTVVVPGGPSQVIPTPR